MGYYDEQKRARYQKVQKTVEEAEETLEKEKLISKMKVEEGLTEKTAKEYIKDLLNADKLKETEEGFIEKTKG